MKTQRDLYESDGPGMSILYIIIGVIILAVVYYAATSYWAPKPTPPVLYACPDGYAYLKRDNICVPGAKPIPRRGIVQ